MKLTKFLKPGVIKSHADIVGYYLARIQSVVVMVGAFKLLGLSWFWAIGLFSILVIVAIAGSYLHLKYVFPVEANYLREKEPFMVEVYDMLVKICRKLKLPVRTFKEMNQEELNFTKEDDENGG